MWAEVQIELGDFPDDIPQSLLDVAKHQGLAVNTKIEPNIRSLGWFLVYLLGVECLAAWSSALALGL